MIFLKRSLLIVGVSLMLLFFALPMLMIPFAHKLPYLGTLSFFPKLLYSFLIFVFSYVIVLIGAKPQNRDGGTRMLKQKLMVTLLSFCFFVFMGAYLCMNSLGSLVKILPNEPYSAQVEIVNMKEKGSKSESINLDLKSNTDGQIYYLTLSKQLFNYPKFNIGDKLILKGKQNWFGVYIEEFQRA